MLIGNRAHTTREMSTMAATILKAMSSLAALSVGKSELSVEWYNSCVNSEYTHILIHQSSHLYTTDLLLV